MQPRGKIRHDKYLRDYRNSLRAARLAELDWYLYRINCNPFRKSSPAHGAYQRAFIRARFEEPHPKSDRLGSLPAVRKKLPTPCPPTE